MCELRIQFVLPQFRDAMAYDFRVERRIIVIADQSDGRLMWRKVSVPERGVRKNIREGSSHDHEFLARQLKQGQPLAKNAPGIQGPSHGPEVIPGIKPG